MWFSIDTSSATAIVASAMRVELIWLCIIVIVGFFSLAAWAASYETYHTILALTRGELIAAQVNQEKAVITGYQKWLRPFYLSQFIIYWPSLADGFALIVEFSDVVAPDTLKVGLFTTVMYYYMQATRITMIVALVACVYALVGVMFAKRRSTSEKSQSSSEVPIDRSLRVQHEKEQSQ